MSDKNIVEILGVINTTVNGIKPPILVLERLGSNPHDLVINVWKGTNVNPVLIYKIVRDVSTGFVLFLFYLFLYIVNTSSSGWHLCMANTTPTGW